MIEAFLSLSADASSRARIGECRRFTIANNRFVIRGESPLLDAMTGAIDHHADIGGGSDDLDIQIWQGDPSPLQYAPGDWLVGERWRRREPVWASSEAGMVHFDPVGGAVSIYDARGRSAGLWLEDASAIPIWIAAAPYLRIFDAWFVGQGMMPCHGAAVARGGAAALIIGSGGAGKSSLAIRAVGQGFDYIGDDYVLLANSNGRPVVHNLYSSAKLTHGDVEQSIPAGFNVHRRPEDPDEKLFLRVRPAAVRGCAPISIVIAPRIADVRSPAAEAISRAEALRIALPSALQQLPGEYQRKLAILGQAFNLPCVRLHLSPKHEDNLALVNQCLRASAGSVTA